MTELVYVFALEAKFWEFESPLGHHLKRIYVVSNNYEKKFPDWKERVIDASRDNLSASSAAASLGVKYDTYKKYAEKYGCFITNQAGKGISRDNPLNRIPLQQILAGEHPQYKTYDLKNRLYKEGLLHKKCSICGITEWLGKPIALHLDHIDGVSSNHRFENLRILCPNCHSQTDTWCGKNKGINS